MKNQRLKVPKDRNGLSSPLGRGGSPNPEPPDLAGALGRRQKGLEPAVPEDKIKGPLGR
jgi:hypothetical protein